MKLISRLNISQLILFLKLICTIFISIPWLSGLRSKEQYLFYSLIWWDYPGSPVVGGGRQKCPYQNTHLTLTCDTEGAELQCTAGCCCGEMGWCEMASGMDSTWNCPRQYWLAKEEAPSLSVWPGERHKISHVSSRYRCADKMYLSVAKWRSQVI